MKLSFRSFYVLTSFLIFFGASSTAFTADTIESNENYWFKKGVESYQKSNWEDAQKNFEEGLKYGKELDPYFHFYIGETVRKNGKASDALPVYEKALKETSSPRLRMEVLQKIIELHLQNKDYSKALVVLNKNRRYLRSRSDRPQMTFFQARIHKHLKNKKQMCDALENLYSKYPDFKLVSKWGIDLEGNEFEGEFTGCPSSVDEFRERVRNLLWAGLDEKALKEVEAMRERYKQSNPALGDSILAQFYVQEGEIGKAYDLLSPHYEKMKHDEKFLTQFAVSAARKGDIETTYKIYREIHRISPKSKMGRKALFQAAFLSYQFNNYDRAASTFKEFIQKYPRSGLRKDSEWHLAWIDYLRGNYKAARKAFKKQMGIRHHDERAQYWLAMASYRDGDINYARKLFAELAKDPLQSYYSLAARFRLNSLPSAQPVQKALASITSRFATAGRSMFNYLKPDDERRYVVEDPGQEREQDMIYPVVDDDPRDVEEEEEKEIFAEKGDEVMKTSRGDVVTRVKMFKELGLMNWARDEIQRFDRRKKDRKFLEEVWQQFSDLGLYNYSSELARGVFNDEKKSKNIEKIQNYYVKTYPRAYEDYVLKSSKGFQVKPEFIWAIMRTESQYKQEAVSPVGALGLMQVMPLTGRKMAEKIGLRDFDPPMLLEPDVAIKVGASYLQRLSKKFSNEIPLTAAAYNAGPHRVKMWVSSIGPREWDEFIDHIPFVETRNYVKRVVLSYQIYKWSQKKEFDEDLDLSKQYKFKMSEPVPLRETWEDI